ncbi:MAG: endopeptidase La [Firmicutes bacterium]|nr:endopeptidase La [Bacillota bacterium]
MTERRLPVIPLRGITVFPNMVVSFSIGRKKSLAALTESADYNGYLFLIAQVDAKIENPTEEDLYSMGCVAKVKQTIKLPGDVTHLIVEGVERAVMLEYQRGVKCDYAAIKTVPQDREDYDKAEIDAVMRAAAEVFDEYTKVDTKGYTAETVTNVISTELPGQMADLMTAGSIFKVEQRQQLLETLDPIKRLEMVVQYLSYELEVLKLKNDIDSKVKAKLEKAQRDYYLREQLKVIQEELGDKDGIQAMIDEYTERLNNKNMPEEAYNVCSREINRLEKLQLTSPEANVVRQYVELILDLPWSEKSDECYDIKKASEILERDHYGMEKVKERVLEYIAVREMSPESEAPIICLVGPPGVGKTSIAKSIAEAVNRKYVRMSLGGVKDESEIRGHRKTYVGAMPGRIIESMKKAGTTNPLLLLDEVDKLSASYSGDPGAALLEVMDSKQNFAFRDHYLEIPYDLSNVMFICTANDLSTIPGPLRDRMEIIELSSYIDEEKKHIAMKYLYPKQVANHGLTKSKLKISEAAIIEVINGYTKEAGVRQLERAIGSICRKAARIMLEEGKKSCSVSPKNLETYLGRVKYKNKKKNDKPQAGIVRGLAWTSVGGETLSIEVNTMKGEGKFVLTGNMGDIMKESAQAAISYIRANADSFKIENDFYKTTDIHIHIPEGAVPKDGPSAGITMASAMVSALTGVPVREDVAMTGEITIRGRVLAIGGLKEKVIAAKRAGITKVIIPNENEGDLTEIPDEVKDGLEFVPVGCMNEVLDNIIVEGESVWR